VGFDISWRFKAIDARTAGFLRLGKMPQSAPDRTLTVRISQSSWGCGRTSTAFSMADWICAAAS
jgi:hypothetical protein